MSEQDKQAFDELWSGIYYHDTNPKKEDVELGWQSALEYARGPQEPVAGVVLSSDGPSLIKRGTERDHIARNGGSLLYTHPAHPVQPAVAVNQQELCPSCRNSDIYACTCTFKTARNQQFEPAPLVRLTEGELFHIFDCTSCGDDAQRNILNFANAIMDAIEEKNK